MLGTRSPYGSGSNASDVPCGRGVGSPLTHVCFCAIAIALFESTTRVECEPGLRGLCATIKFDPRRRSGSTAPFRKGSGKSSCRRSGSTRKPTTTLLHPNRRRHAHAELALHRTINFARACSAPLPEPRALTPPSSEATWHQPRARFWRRSRPREPYSSPHARAGSNSSKRSGRCWTG